MKRRYVREPIQALYVKALKLSSVKEQYALVEQGLKELYPNEVVDLDFVKEKINQNVRSLISKNFRKLDGKKVRVFYNPMGEEFLDKELKTPMPESAERIDAPIVWEKKEHKSSTDKMLELLAGVEVL